MYEHEKSDECVEPKKLASKGKAAARPAERVEGRREGQGELVEGNQGPNAESGKLAQQPSAGTRSG